MNHWSTGIRRCALGPPVAPDRAGPERTARRVRARFTLSDLPLLTSSPHRIAVLRAISRTLAHLGRGYLGGHAEISCDGAAPRGCRVLTHAECLAAVRAVEDALAGGRGVASLRMPARDRRPPPYDPG